MIHTQATQKCFYFTRTITFFNNIILKTLYPYTYILNYLTGYNYVYRALRWYISILYFISEKRKAFAPVTSKILFKELKKKFKSTGNILAHILTCSPGTHDRFLLSIVTEPILIWHVDLVKKNDRQLAPPWWIALG